MLEHYVQLIQMFGSADGFNTEWSERLHIDYAKDAYRASNRRDYVAQMTVWLSRQEKVDRFSVYLQWCRDGSYQPTHEPPPSQAIFLESGDWNAHMRMRSSRTSTSGSDAGGAGIFDNFTDSFVNAFTKVHKPDRRFIEVKEKADKLDEDLNHVEKIVARVARRESDLETDYNELATQFRKLVPLEPDVEVPLQVFAASVEETARGIKNLKDHTDQNYLGSLRDMEAYILSVKALLKSREQKQLDFEALVDYRNKATAERESLESNPSSYYASNPLTSSRIPQD